MEGRIFGIYGNTCNVGLQGFSGGLARAGM